MTLLEKAFFKSSNSRVFSILACFTLLARTHAKGCFALDTPVTLADGSRKAIGDIEPGESVLSWDPALHLRSYAQVLQVHTYRRENLISLQIGANSNIRIHATADHPFWSRRAKQIVSRDPLATTLSYGLETAMLEDIDVFENDLGQPVEVHVSANISSLMKDHGWSGNEAHMSIQVATLCLNQHHWFFVHGVRAHNKGGGGCFTLDTPVTLADGSWKPIGNIRPGDYVRSWSSRSQSISHAQVLQVQTHWRENLISLQIGANSKNRIYATADHPFWSHRARQIVSRDPAFTTQLYGLESAWLEEMDLFENELGEPVEVHVSPNISSFMEDRAGIANEMNISIQVATLSLDRHHWFFVHGVRAHNKGGGSRGHSSSDDDGEGLSWTVFILIGTLCIIVMTVLYCAFAYQGGSEGSEEYQGRSASRDDFAREVGAIGAASSDGRLPPSGEWTGTYEENAWSFFGGEKVASYNLTFTATGGVHGSGYDADGTSIVQGSFSLQSGKMKWVERYSWGSIELDGSITHNDYNTSINASFISTLNVSGTLLIKPKGGCCLPSQQLRQSARAALYGTEAGSEEQPPSLEKNPSWGSHSKPNRVTRANNQAKYTLARVASRRKLGTRLQSKAERADGQLGSSKMNLTSGRLANSSKVSPENGGLPPNWIMVMDTTYNTGMPYYVNTVTKETSWTRPR